MTHKITKEDLEKFQRKFQDAESIEDLIGREGIITDLFKGTLQSMLEAEATNHLGYPKGVRQLKRGKNKRNGSSAKKVRSSFGEAIVNVPRDREGSFEPKLIEKYQKNTSELEDKIISMYGRGMTVGDLNEHLADLYGIHISDPLISTITDKIWPKVEEWRNRPLETVYPVVFIDAIHLKVREDGMVKTKAVYLVIGYNVQGMKEVLGMWIGEAESAKFWLGALTELKERGVEDILILCCDNLKGISEAIQASFPATIIQKCIVHQIRNSLKYIASKDSKEFLVDLKTVYRAATKDEAEINLLKLDEKWGSKYGIVLKSWQNNWEELSQYFQFDSHIRKMIYTTNLIEGYNRQLRKVTKNRGVFPSNKSVMKLLYLATQNISKKWTMPRQNWAQAIAQLNIHFPERIPMDI